MKNPNDPNKSVRLEDFNYSSKCFVSNIVNPANKDEVISSNNRCHQYSCSEDYSTITIVTSHLPDFSFVCGPGD